MIGHVEPGSESPEHDLGTTQAVDPREGAASVSGNGLTMLGSTDQGEACADGFCAAG